jgi:hypothetical protein
MANPETAVNSATGRLDAAITENLTVDVSADVTMTTTSFQSAYKFNLTPVGSGKKLTLPAVKRLALFHNQDATNAAIIKRGTTELSLPPGYMSLFYVTGTTNGLLQIKTIGAPTHFYGAPGAPSGVAGAIDGDFYVNTTSGLLYQLGLATPGTWTSTGIVLGGGGAGGAPLWFQGGGSPGSVVGSSDGDMYYDTSSGNLWQKGLNTAGTWDLTGVTLATGGGGGGGSADIKPPSTALFNYSANGTGVTQAATYNAVRGFVLERTDALSGGDHAAFRGKAVPSGNWEAIAKIETGPIGGSDFIRWGLAIHNSANKDTIMAGIDLAGGSPLMRSVRFNALDNYTAALGTYPASGSMGGWIEFPKWFKISWDGTNYTFYVSLDDAITWRQLYQATAASLFTATHIGLVMQHFNGRVIGEWKLNCRYYSDPDFP